MRWSDTRRLVRLLLRLYPRAYRDRYGAEIEALVQGKPQVGGVASFTGYVRDFSEASGVVAMTLAVPA